MSFKETLKMKRTELWNTENRKYTENIQKIGGIGIGAFFQINFLGMRGYLPVFELSECLA